MYTFKNNSHVEIFKFEYPVKLNKTKLKAKVQNKIEQLDQAGFNMNGRFAVSFNGQFIYYI